MTKIDTTKLSAKQLKDLEALLGKAGTSVADLSKKTGKAKSRMSDPAYRQLCIDLRPKVEQFCIENGVEKLQHVYTASLKERALYRHPDGKTWNSKGKMPHWLEGRKEQYIVRKDGRTDAERPADAQTDIEDTIHNNKLNAIAEAPDGVDWGIDVVSK
jgi:hypothetical protein